MSNEIVKELTPEDVSPLGNKILALFAWFGDNIKGDHSGAMSRLPTIFGAPQEELDAELDKLVELGFLSLNKPN